MNLPKLTCVVLNQTRPLPQEILTCLSITAQHMIQMKWRKFNLTMDQNGLVGEISTECNNRMLGDFIGMVFRSTLAMETDIVKIELIVKPDKDVLLPHFGAWTRGPIPGYGTGDPSRN